MKKLQRYLYFILCGGAEEKYVIKLTTGKEKRVNFLIFFPIQLWEV